MMQTQIFKPRNAAIAVGTWMVLSMTSSVFAVEILDDPAQIEERATQLMQASNSLCWEMFRYHQQQPDYRDSYQAAKDLWSQSTQLRDMLWAGPVETATLIQRVGAMNDTFMTVERSLTKWGPGDQTSVASTSTSTVRTVVTPGVGVNLPFLNVQVGGRSQVEEIIDEGLPPLQRLKLHPNAHGSKRSLERELFSVKLALKYLMEDAGMPVPPTLSAGNETIAAPQAPRPDSTLSQPETIVPARKQETTPDRP